MPARHSTLHRRLAAFTIECLLRPGLALYRGQLDHLEDDVLKISEVEPRHYREAMAHFAGAVQVVTTDGASGRRGITVIAACSVSDNPPMVLVCINHGNPANEAFVANGVFALNTLGEQSRALAHGFSGLTGLDQDERFALGQWDTIATGAPTLTDALAVFDCEVIEAKAMATHHVIFGRVRGLRIGSGMRPLIYYNRGYGIDHA